MRRDLQSYELHNKDYYTVFDLKNCKKRIEEYDKLDTYGVNGFRNAVEKAAKRVQTHIDVGCGTGWLLLKTAPLFKKVIGIEPSTAAVESAKVITSAYSNVSYRNEDMVDVFNTTTFDEPVFLTTGAVLSHIKDFYVKSFLQSLASLPNGSLFFFGEPYGQNIQQNMWHIRSKEWWAKNLPEWELSFLDIKNAQYTNGIWGEKVGREKRMNSYAMTLKEKVCWVLQGLVNKIKRILRGLSRLFTKTS